MADHPQKTGHARPLSPHVFHYRWQLTMLGSITHRLTGMALSVGTLALAWWLVSISNGPESYQFFTDWAATPLGLIVLFGFVWSLAFHLLNGVRHLAWDTGYGFEVKTANRSGIFVIALSVIVAVGIFVYVFAANGAAS